MEPTRIKTWDLTEQELNRLLTSDKTLRGVVLDLNGPLVVSGQGEYQRAVYPSEIARTEPGILAGLWSNFKGFLAAAWGLNRGWSL